MGRGSDLHISNETRTRKRTKEIPTPESMLKNSRIFRHLRPYSSYWLLYAAALESLLVLGLPATLEVQDINGCEHVTLTLIHLDGPLNTIH